MSTEPRVLFVDDEESIRLTLPMMLQTFGFKVSTAATVAEALRQMSEHQFDVLISDMNIERPGDGFTVVNAMRSTQPKVVRLILTGYPDIESALMALRESVDDYLIKPTETEEIVAKVRSKLETETRRRELPPKPLSEIIDREREYITRKWLELAKADADLSTVSLSGEERKDHVPRLLNIAVEILKGHELTSENRQVAAQHGETRHKQGYSTTWLLRETKLLQDAIAACIHKNLLEIQISTLIPDVVRVFGIVQSLLEESLSAFLNQQVSRKPKRK